MSDDKTKKKPLDSSRINIHEPYEVSFWCGALGCTKQELVNAVKKHLLVFCTSSCSIFLSIMCLFTI